MGVTWRIQGYYKADAQKVVEEIGFGKFTPMEVLEKAKKLTNNERALKAITFLEDIYE